MTFSPQFDSRCIFKINNVYKYKILLNFQFLLFSYNVHNICVTYIVKLAILHLTILHFISHLIY